MKHFFHPAAFEEYVSAAGYYTAINPHLAESFIRAVESAIKDILKYPEAWQTIEDDVRRRLVRRFPFGIYYCIEGDAIMIYAIMHMSRHPDYWKGRLRQPQDLE